MLPTARARIGRGFPTRSVHPLQSPPHLRGVQVEWLHRPDCWFGLGAAVADARRLHKPIEYRQRVQRTRAALGVVLDRLDRLHRVAQPLDGAVVEVDLTYDCLL